MRWPAFALAILLAGCIQVEGPSEGPQHVEAGLGAPRAIAATNNSQGEAFLAVSRDGGTLLACIHGDFKEHSPAFVSEDRGASWRRLAPPEGAAVGGDCEVAISEDGRWWWLSSTIASASIATSADRGRTWSLSHLAATPSNGGADRPWLEGAGDAMVLTYMPAFLLPGAVGVTRSTDGGASWAQPQTLGTHEGDRTAFAISDMSRTSEGDLVFAFTRFQSAWGTSGEGVGDIFLARSLDAGATWRVRPIVQETRMRGDPPSFAASRDGALFLAYPVPNGTFPPGAGRFDLVLQTSRDEGETWSPPRVLLPGSIEVLTHFDYPYSNAWLTGGPNGRASLILQGDGAPFGMTGTRLLVLGLDARSDDVIVASPAASQILEFATGVYADDGTRHVAWIDDGTLWYASDEAGDPST